MSIPNVSPAPSAVFQIEHLSKTYGDPPTALANDDISLAIAQGTIWGVLGPNGAGKTTLIRQMLGLLKPTGGRGLLYGVDIAGHPDLIPREVGYLAQTGQALWDFTPEEALYFTGRLRGMGHHASRQEAARLIEAWQIGPFRRRVLRYTSYLVPTTYATQAVRAGLTSQLDARFWLNLGVLALFCVVILTLVARRLDWRA
jgi:ABC-type multidrug transport system ATPase subunit